MSDDKAKVTNKTVQAATQCYVCGALLGQSCVEYGEPLPDGAIHWGRYRAHLGEATGEERKA